MEKLSATARAECDRAIESFEHAWFCGKPADIEDFLPVTAEWRHVLLVELVHIELEWRQKSGAEIDVDHYLKRFPELGADPAAWQSLRMDAAKLRQRLPRHLPVSVCESGTRLKGLPSEANSSLVRFRILRPHARGGLGQVSLALDQELHREVALKEIQPQHADDIVARERFVIEAEITGSLEHPGIVPIYGLGQYADGRPFYAMRFVKGDSLKHAIDEFHKLDNPNRKHEGTRNLELRQLLRRFIDVCNAIDFAHSRGVIHRDLKPANIMLGNYGETLVVDWGLAKYMGEQTPASGPDPRPTLSSLSDSARTQPGSAIGTPAYMSPEQAVGKLDELAPSSDVYSLGATFYHLLCGRPPFEKDQVNDILAKVQQGDFLKPRSVEHNLPVALEAICLKAMSLKSSDRYPTARSLADDVEHWLADEPVHAYRENWTAQLARMCRHHQVFVGTGLTLLFVTLVAAMIGTVIVAAEREKTAHAAKEAEISRRATTEVAGLLDGLFRSADPVGLDGFGFREGTQRAADLTGRHLLDAGTRQVAERLNEQPDVQASLFETMGNSYRALGNYDAANRVLTQSLEIRMRLFGHENIDVASSLFALGMLQQDKGQYAKAEEMIRESLELRVRLLGPEHLDVARTKFQLAWLFCHQPLAAVPDHTRMQAAEQLVRDVLEIRRSKLGLQHREVGMTLAGLAGIRMARGAEADAKSLLLQAFLILDQPQNSSDIGSGLAHFIQGEVARSLRDFKAAVISHRKVVEIANHHLGDQHPVFAILLANLAGTERQAGDMAAAEKDIRQVLAIARNSFLRSHPGILDMFIQVADGLRNRGDMDEAESLYREAIMFGQNEGPACAPIVDRAQRALDELLKQKEKPAIPD